MSKRTNHGSFKRVLYNLSNRCYQCGMKIPKGDVHYINGEPHCGKCVYEKGEFYYGNGKEERRN